MNVVFNIRTILAYSLISFFVVIPRMLYYFGLEHEYVLTLIAPWATFLIILLAIIIYIWHYVLNIKTFIFAIAIALVIALVLTLFMGI